MRRLATLLSVLMLGALCVVGCATYKQDLERAQHHYEANQFEPALALFRVLEFDMDSFTPGEQAQYAYLRGMTDFRLSSLAQPGSGAADPKVGFRMNARHWLGVAAAIEKVTPGGLSGDEKARLDETMADLNRDVYGGADSAAPDAGAPPAAGTPSAAPASAPCKNDKDCPGDTLCEKGTCSAPVPKPKP